MVDIKKALSAGHKIGSLTWYDCENASITPSRLKHLFNEHGLDERYLPPDKIKPKHAFQRACRYATTTSGTTSDNRKSITKLIVDGMDKIVYGIVDLNVQEEIESLDPDFNDKIWFDKNTEEVKSMGNHPLTSVIKDEYNRLCGEFSTRDISRMITTAIKKMAAISMRKAGVVYFVPIAYDKDINALKNVVNSIGNCDMKVYALGSNENTENMKNSAKSQIADRISKMKDDLESLKMSISSKTLKGGNASNSIEVRRKRYNELKHQCKVLADALHIKAEMLEKDLDSVGKMLDNELDGFLAV